jgi:hypothetical protein
MFIAACFAFLRVFLSVPLFQLFLGHNPQLEADMFGLYMVLEVFYVGFISGPKRKYK